MNDPVVNLTAERHIPIAKPTIGKEEMIAVAKVLKSGWITQGERVAEFEREFAKLHDCEHGIACNSGTAALAIALRACDLKPDDEVICSTLTMVAAANAIITAGATPAFVDVNAEDGNPCPLAIAKAINPKTKAIVLPHLYGVASYVAAAFPWKRLGIKVIEDCAEAHFAKYPDGRSVGSIGDMACFSFYANKIVTTGEGGMVLCNDAKLAARLRGLRSHAFSPQEHFVHTELAYGARMTDVQAAIGLAQLERREEIIGGRALLAETYLTHAIELKQKRLSFFPATRPSWAANWVMPMLAGGELLCGHARSALAKAGVETRALFVPLRTQAHLRRHSLYCGSDSCVASNLASRGFYLPLCQSLSKSDVDYICKALCSI